MRARLEQLAELCAWVAGHPVTIALVLALSLALARALKLRRGREDQLDRLWWLEG